MLQKSTHLVVFSLEQRRFAVSMAHVVRVVPAAPWTPIPGSPEIVLGILDFHGEVVPVLDPGYRFAGSRPPVCLTDQLLVVRTHRRLLALLVDTTLGVIERDAAAVASLDPLELGAEQFEGAVVLDDGLVLIHDIEKFLSPQEGQALEWAIEESSRESARASP